MTPIMYNTVLIVSFIELVIILNNKSSLLLYFLNSILLNCFNIKLLIKLLIKIIKPSFLLFSIIRPIPFKMYNGLTNCR